MNKLPAVVRFEIFEWITTISPIFMGKDEYITLKVLEIYDKVLQGQFPIAGKVVTNLPFIEHVNVCQDRPDLFVKLNDIGQIFIYGRDYEKTIEFLNEKYENAIIPLMTNSEETAVELLLERSEGILNLIPTNIVKWVLAGSSVFKAVYNEPMNKLSDFDIFIYDYANYNKYHDFLQATVNIFKSECCDVKIKYQTGLVTFTIDSNIIIEFVFTDENCPKYVVEHFDMNHLELYAEKDNLDNWSISVSSQAIKSMERNYTKYATTFVTAKNTNRIVKTLENGIGLMKFDSDDSIFISYPCRRHESWFSNTFDNIEPINKRYDNGYEFIALPINFEMMKLKFKIRFNEIDYLNAEYSPIYDGNVKHKLWEENRLYTNLDQDYFIAENVTIINIINFEDEISGILIKITEDSPSWYYVTYLFDNEVKEAKISKTLQCRYREKMLYYETNTKIKLINGEYYMSLEVNHLKLDKNTYFAGDNLTILHELYSDCILSNSLTFMKYVAIEIIKR